MCRAAASNQTIPEPEGGGSADERARAHARDEPGNMRGWPRCPAGPKRPRPDMAARHRWSRPGRRPQPSFGRRSNGRAEVAECVPGFLDDEDAVPGITHADIDGVGRVGRVRREFEDGRPTRLPGQTEQVLLHREVASVGRLSHRAKWPRQRDGQGLLEGHADPDPRFQRGAPAATELDAADPGLMKADHRPELLLGEPGAPPPRPHCCPERDGDGPRQARGLPDGVGLPGSGR
jgi:hypothetical protein